MLPSRQSHIPGVAELADAMIDNSVQAIILNESYLDMIAELSNLQTADTEAEEGKAIHDYAAFVKSLRKISGLFGCERERTAGRRYEFLRQWNLYHVYQWD